MHILAAVLTLALVGYFLIAGLLGRRRFELMLERLRTDPGFRARYYRRGIIRQWLTCGVIALVGLLAERPRSDILLRWPRGGAGVSTGESVGLAVGLAFGVVLVARLRNTDIGRGRLERLMGKTHELLPTNRTERLWFVPLSLTAGICEEIMFRGFLLAVVFWLRPETTVTHAALATAVVFGLGHLYQGVRGVVLTGVVGYLLAELALNSHSLVIPMGLHILIDVRWALLPNPRSTAASSTATE